MAAPARRCHALSYLLLAAALLAASHWATELLGGSPTALAAAPAASPGAAAAAYLARAVFVVGPGLLVGLAGAELYKRQNSMSKAALGVGSLLLLLVALAAPLALDQSAGAGGAAAPAPQEPAAMQQPMPHSGELRLTDSGAILQVSDPREPEGSSSVQPGWQQALWVSMTEAVRAGQEQVVMVFSREGCPWCDRLVPVLENVIRQRAANADPAGGLATSPLRVFIYDAAEFGPIVQKFQLQGFPSILIFGNAGVKPRMIPGYVPEDDLNKYLLEAANAQPEMEEPVRPKRRGLFGLR